MNQPAVETLVPTGQRARDAAGQLAVLGTARKNEALESIARGLELRASSILAANRADIEEARAAGLTDALIDRLLLNEDRLASLATDTRKIIDLPDPVGTDITSRVLPNGLRLTRRRVPIGVLGVIYEARPNVTIDIATLCLKTGNAVILRGGSETLRSNLALTDVIRKALEEVGFPVDAIQYIDNPDRSLVKGLLQLDEFVDMIVPRGGARLHELCRKQSTIPVITGGIGICHIFVDESADLDRAIDIVENAKVQRPSVCNALDTLLVHRSVAQKVLPAVVQRLSASGVEFRADPEAAALLDKIEHEGEVAKAGPDDFDQEWLSLVLGLRIVSDLDEAVEHIRLHGTDHSDSILTENHRHADRFVSEVNSAAVYVNASTRFTDGGQFGLGAEVAVSTQKLHARGPMGLEELTTYKWVIYGDGHIRS